jgi:aminopeptidase N
LEFADLASFSFMLKLQLAKHHAFIISNLFALLVLLISQSASVAAQARNRSVDVLHYDVALEPDIRAKTIKGTVKIRFTTTTALNKLTLNSGDLAIDGVRSKGRALQNSVAGHRLEITLPATLKPRAISEVEVAYHGSPRYGIRFFPEKNQVYTIFSTSQWMICEDSPDDRATLRIVLTSAPGLTHLSNGRETNHQALADGRIQTTWSQTSPVPTYTFGFVIGPFRTLSERRGAVELRYLATSFSDDQVLRIFRDTKDMMNFFEDRAGVKYQDHAYSQVLATGDAEQEMSSFTALNEDYGSRVLADEKDIWLGAHEFAHQWWGNMVTCEDWNHFWLNEGIATFMAAAYLEHRFGHESYLKEIEQYRSSYEKIKSAGKDKSLVFPNWLHPTREDRTLVYDKGAYVMHLLREEMGEKAFWKGLRSYTRANFGRSVVTRDFEKAMDASSGKSLTRFFSKWIYLNDSATQ